jgi:flavin reductase (DIM6/NTAB) family NADH-FMN oxidoreductase RutF
MDIAVVVGNPKPHSRVSTDVQSAALPDHELRHAYSLFPSGVTALCALTENGPVGMAASSFTSVSLQPPLVSVCVDQKSTTWPTLAGAERLGVSVLGSDHAGLCRALAARNSDRFADASWESRPGGAIFIHGGSLWLECTTEQTVMAGDHLIVLLRVLATQPFPDVSPLIFHLSTLRQLGA